ncbi:fascin 1/2 [Mytilus galloprovincialis]|uniref:Fascin n=3 Tax=Mytilus galloprovincialis TaxID=29158 RepID=A0A8B6EK85_MYTGA|nr:fascin 1/2 [Mytilus galloprovincialis]
MSTNRFSWPAGLQNSAFNFITSEDFGYELTILGTGLNRKQIWTLELNHDETVYMKNRFERYLTVDKFGAVKCESEELIDDGKFNIEFSPDGSGRWAFKSEKYGTYLGGNDQKVVCLSRKVSENELWYVPMARHPQIVLGNKRRKRYFGLVGNEVICQDRIPWGQHSIFTLEYHLGKYLIKTSDNRYLRKDGTLTESKEPGTYFTLELRVNSEPKLEGIAFRDDEGKYLGGVGIGSQSVTLKTDRKTITDEEIFQLEESNPQVVFVAPNENNVSIQTGFGLSASTDQESKKEIFQIEFDNDTNKWYIITSEYKFWSVSPSNKIEATSTSRNPDCLFQFEWLCGTVAVIAANGKYVGIQPNGQMTAKSDGIGAKEIFRIKLINRQMLILKGDYGYVGKKSSSSKEPVYSCNKSMYDVLELEHGDKGVYYIKGDNGKYWNLKNTTISPTGTDPEPFILEFMGHCLLAILAPNTKYINGEKSGGFEATTQVIQKSCLWRF